MSRVGFRQTSKTATPHVGVVPTLVRYSSAQAWEPRGRAPVAGRDFDPLAFVFISALRVKSVHDQFHGPGGRALLEQHESLSGLSELCCQAGVVEKLAHHTGQFLG